MDTNTLASRPASIVSPGQLVEDIMNKTYVSREQAARRLGLALEELDSADLLIHVADASHTDLFLQISSVETILDTLDLGKVPRLLVLNKWDLLDPAVQAELGDALPDALHVSALKGTGLETLMKAIESRLLGLKT